MPADDELYILRFFNVYINVNATIWCTLLNPDEIRGEPMQFVLISLSDGPACIIGQQYSVIGTVMVKAYCDVSAKSARAISMASAIAKHHVTLATPSLSTLATSAQFLLSFASTSPQPASRRRLHRIATTSIHRYP